MIDVGDPDRPQAAGSSTITEGDQKREREIAKAPELAKQTSEVPSPRSGFVQQAGCSEPRDCVYVPG